MFHPKNHFGLVWFVLSLASAEFFMFRVDGLPGPWIVTVLFGLIYMYVTFLPALLVVITIYSIMGWLD